jgi:hypothetical protein
MRRRVKASRQEIPGDRMARHAFKKECKAAFEGREGLRISVDFANFVHFQREGPFRPLSFFMGSVVEAALRRDSAKSSSDNRKATTLAKFENRRRRTADARSLRLLPLSTRL